MPGSCMWIFTIGDRVGQFCGRKTPPYSYCHYCMAHVASVDSKIKQESLKKVDEKDHKN